jgi:hypothetical protein
MKPFMIAILATSAFSIARAGTPKNVTFPGLPAVVPIQGEKYQVTFEQLQHGSYAFAGNEHQVDDTLTATFTVEVIGVHDELITDKRITFVSAHIRTAGGKTDKDLPVTGKTYRLHNSLSHHFEREDGATISPEERYALSQIDQLKVPDAPSVLFAGKTFVTGATVVVKRPQWLPAFQDAVGIGLVDAVLDLTLRVADSSAATFTTRRVSTGKLGSLAFTIEQQGTLVVDRARARPLEITTRATQKASGKMGKDAAGTALDINTHVVIQYEPAALGTVANVGPFKETIPSKQRVAIEEAIQAALPKPDPKRIAACKPDVDVAVAASGNPAINDADYVTVLVQAGTCLHSAGALGAAMLNLRQALKRANDPKVKVAVLKELADAEQTAAMFEKSADHRYEYVTAHAKLGAPPMSAGEARSELIIAVCTYRQLGNEDGARRVTGALRGYKVAVDDTTCDSVRPIPTN